MIACDLWLYLYFLGSAIVRTYEQLQVICDLIFFFLGSAIVRTYE